MKQCLISAYAKSDDNRLKVTFDATDYFAQASDNDILAIVAEDFNQGYACDAVARFYCDHITEMTEFFRYLELGRWGFEVYINQAEAIGWLLQNRPHIVVE